MESRAVLHLCALRWLLGDTLRKVAREFDELRKGDGLRVQQPLQVGHVEILHSHDSSCSRLVRRGPTRGYSQSVRGSLTLGWRET